jgi:hypothetical protein
MIIQPHLTPKKIDQFDIVFSNGILMPITIDKESGDTVDMSNPLIAIFSFPAKPSAINPDTSIPAEEISIFMAHVFSVTHRIVEIMPPNPDQEQLFRSMHRMPSTIQ